MPAAACLALLASGCGGGSEQTSKEVKHTYRMRITAATFPARQSISRPAEMRVRVRNEDSRTVPVVAITVDSFSYVSKYAELASSKRPIWVVERGPGTIAKSPVQSQAISPPGGGQTAYINTWTLGSLPPGASRTFTWEVIPVKTGTYSVHLTINAGLSGNARVALARPGAVRRSFATTIAPAPPARHVNPDTGKVTPGEFPVSP